MDSTSPYDHLQPRHGQLVNVVIETPLGSASKLKYDEETHLFMLSKVLPAGSRFPYSFGFVPHTRAEDGDPLDVLLLLDDALPTGCLVRARLIGVIEGEDEGGVANPRVIAVADGSRVHDGVSDLSQLPPRLLDEIEHFFVSFHELLDKTWKPTHRRGRAAAERLLAQSASTLDDGGDDDQRDQRASNDGGEGGGDGGEEYADDDVDAGVNG